MDLHALLLRMQALSVLRSTTNSPMVSAYCSVLQALHADASCFSEAYGKLCLTIFRVGDPGKRLVQLVQRDVNPLTASLPDVPPEISLAATADLQTLSALAELDGAALLHAAKKAFPQDAACFDAFPQFSAGTALPFSDGASLARFYQENGFGFFSQSSFFTVDETNQMVPVTHPDPIRLHDLKGYPLQKEKVLANTLAFLDGRPANNILLYGDKGTGKSSTVKAVGNEYAARGLKIIEISPGQIGIFPRLCAEAAVSPFRIIVFLDDLTFDREDENFALLKAFIEGGLTGKPDNLILYATSNRRHLVRESFSDRQGDDIHVRDTLETVTSLSDRFGLEITFSVPDKDEYLSIIDALADEYGLSLPQNELHLLAERFALRRNGRSPRTARQFISYQLTQQDV